MFQYAVGRSLAEKNGSEVRLDLSFLQNQNVPANVTVRRYELSIFNIQEAFADGTQVKRLKNLVTRTVRKFLPNVAGNPYVNERYFQFDPSILHLPDNVYLEGHWMSEKYFENIQSTLRREFTFRKPVIDAAKPLENLIANSNAVCVQVRRGDYVTNPAVAKMHGTTTLDYYRNAVDLIKSKIDNPTFFVFSDDSQWCMEHLNMMAPVYFVEDELKNHPATNSDFLQLMSKCKHFIISNSTFAWWGAWLGNHEQKIVIAPRHWFNDRQIVTSDIYPKEWLKVE